MKVGDLVRFSAYGKKLELHRHIAFYDPVGIIIKSGYGRFHINWCGLTAENFAPAWRSARRRAYFRQDLKYASR
jgi:hypothetical protein